MATYGKYPVRKVRNGPEDFLLKPEQLSPYLGIRCYGAEKLGIKNEDLLVLSGIIKNE
jgi:hypothetical protein